MRAIRMFLEVNRHKSAVGIQHTIATQINKEIRSAGIQKNLTGLMNLKKLASSRKDWNKLVVGAIVAMTQIEVEK